MNIHVCQVCYTIPCRCTPAIPSWPGQPAPYPVTPGPMQFPWWGYLPSQRDYFAGKALQGLCAAISEYSPSRVIDIEGTAREAVGLADALIAALTPNPQGKEP